MSDNGDLVAEVRALIGESRVERAKLSSREGESLPTPIPPPSRPSVRLVAIVSDELRVRVEHPIYLYRYLFADGSVLDVEAASDDSSIRGAILDYRAIANDRVVGIAEVDHVGYSEVDRFSDHEDED